MTILSAVEPLTVLKPQNRQDKPVFSGTGFTATGDADAEIMSCNTDKHSTQMQRINDTSTVYPGAFQMLCRQAETLLYPACQFFERQTEIETERETYIKIIYDILL